MSTIYGIAETLYRDGYIEAKVFSVDEEVLAAKPHFKSGLTTDYSLTTYHLIGEKEKAEEMLDNAKIVLLAGKEISASYPAAGATEETFVRCAASVEDKKGINASDLTARVVYPETPSTKR